MFCFIIKFLFYIILIFNKMNTSAFYRKVLRTARNIDNAGNSFKTMLSAPPSVIYSYDNSQKIHIGSKTYSLLSKCLHTMNNGQYTKPNCTALQTSPMDTFSFVEMIKEHIQLRQFDHHWLSIQEYQSFFQLNIFLLSKYYFSVHT